MWGTYKRYGIVIISTLMVWTVLEYMASNYYHQLDTNDFILPAKKQYVDLREPNESSRCPDVSTGMMKGRWKPRTLTARERVTVDTFLKSVRYRVPKSMQRRDGKCGNVAYINLNYFRALCNPEGATPCCYGYRCTNKSADECKCPKCYDFRNEIHAEYSTWEAGDPRCQVKNFTVQETCDLLHGLTIAFIGDSLMRNLYTALMLMLNNYDGKGVFRAVKAGVLATVSYNRQQLKGWCKNPARLCAGIKDIPCEGMYAFSDRACTPNLFRRKTLCNGTLNVEVSTIPSAVVAKRFHEKFRSFLHKKNTVILVGIGIHDHFNFEKVSNDYIYPVVDMIRKRKASWPKLIWFATHKFGIMKSPLIPRQENSRVVAFNKRMSEALGKYHIPIFDTYNLTSGVMSMDGTHFGIGVSSMKVQMFLNYFLELKSKPHW
ncbi:uncharacterized protein [Haliotis asinina]|uniref:uncharacterized protein n=1 Tax=Haliotis asinina TaxID=109174 RepID=UPI0035322821